MIFKRKPKLPNLFLYLVSMDSEGWDNNDFFQVSKIMLIILKVRVYMKKI